MPGALPRWQARSHKLKRTRALYLPSRHSRQRTRNRGTCPRRPAASAELTDSGRRHNGEALSKRHRPRTLTRTWNRERPASFFYCRWRTVTRAIGRQDARNSKRTIQTGCPGQERAAGDCAQGQGKDGKARLATVPAPCRKEHTASTGPAGIPTVRASLFLGSAQVASVRTLGSQGMADAAPSVLPRAQGLAEQQPGWHVLPCHGAQDG